MNTDFIINSHWLTVIDPFPQESDEENFVDMGDDSDNEKFTDADKETAAEAVKEVEAKETEPEGSAETEKPKAASWVHFDNLKGDVLWLVSLNF